MMAIDWLATAGLPSRICEARRLCLLRVLLSPVRVAFLVVVREAELRVARVWLLLAAMLQPQMSSSRTLTAAHVQPRAQTMEQRTDGCRCGCC